MKTKIIAMYLPQYHSIPENDIFWGKGFTDWVSVKKSKPLFEGHEQPRVPLSGTYYDLSIKKDVVDQAVLAKKYGVYGFGIYHYWFNNEKNLLTKPAEIILSNKDIDMNYFFAWDNISWKRSWSNVKGNDWSPLQDKGIQGKEDSPILIPYILGREDDWKNHFNYLIPYFKDSRYIKVDNKPIFVVYHFSSTILEMAEYWNNLAINNGFNGICCIYRNDKTKNIPSSQYIFTYEPASSGWGGFFERSKSKISNYLGLKQGLKKYDYDEVWCSIIDNARRYSNTNHIPGAFVSYDDTPRRGCRGKVIVNDSPQKFAKYMEELIEINEKQNKDFIFLTAWNEWGEGAYLEPDTKNAYSYLEALAHALNKFK